MNINKYYCAIFWNFASFPCSEIRWNYGIVWSTLHLTLDDRECFLFNISATKIENLLNSVDCNRFDEKGIILKIYEEFGGVFRALSNFYDGVFLWT